MSKINERIQVIGRIRPLTRNELENNDESVVLTSDNSIFVENSNMCKSYQLDSVLDMTDTQLKVFEKVEPLLENVLEGYNCSLVRQVHPNTTL